MELPGDWTCATCGHRNGGWARWCVCGSERRHGGSGRDPEEAAHQEREPASQGVRLYLCDIPPDASAEELRALFEHAGAVEGVSITANLGDGRPIARVQMASKAAAVKAIQWFNGWPLRAHSLWVIPELKELPLPSRPQPQATSEDRRRRGAIIFLLALFLWFAHLAEVVIAAATAMLFLFFVSRDKTGRLWDKVLYHVRLVWRRAIASTVVLISMLVGAALLMAAAERPFRAKLIPMGLTLFAVTIIALGYWWQPFTRRLLTTIPDRRLPYGQFQIYATTGMGGVNWVESDTARIPAVFFLAGLAEPGSPPDDELD